MKRVGLLFLLMAPSVIAGICVQPATTIHDSSSPYALTSAAIAALATADSAYSESLLSPERSVNSSEVSPLARAKRCIEGYMLPFQNSPSRAIKDAAGLFTTAMIVLENNERDLQDNLLRLDRGSSPEALRNYVTSYIQNGQGRWYSFLNAATATVFAISDRAGDGNLAIGLEPDERAALRSEIVNRFTIQRLSSPGLLRPSPAKGASMLYLFLKNGSLDFSSPEWK